MHRLPNSVEGELLAVGAGSVLPHGVRGTICGQIHVGRRPRRAPEEKAQTHRGHSHRAVPRPWEAKFTPVLEERAQIVLVCDQVLPSVFLHL